MKTLLTISILFLSISLQAQLFFIIEPQFIRPGLMYNHDLKSFGLYSHVWAGNIKGNIEYGGGDFYTDNIKIAVGISSLPDDEQFKFYLGLNYNNFFNTKVNYNGLYNGKIILDKVHKFSFELGISKSIGRVTMLMITDFLNWESLVGISINLKTKKDE